MLLRFRNKRVLTSLSRRRDKKVEWKTGGEGGGGGGVERGGEGGDTRNRPGEGRLGKKPPRD